MSAASSNGFVIRARAFTVVGAGKSGLAAANMLVARGAGRVRLVDDKADIVRPEALDPRVDFVAGSHEVLPGDTAVLSPGIPEVSPIRVAIARVASEVIGEVELFYRLCPAPILAITGTDGKSTVTTMLGDIVARTGRPTFVGGNLGNPLCEGLSDLTPAHAVVAEVSCFQLTTCSTFRPRVAVVTNIAPDHLDYHGSFEAYQAAKRLVWRAMTPHDVVLLNADDPNIATWTLPDPTTGPRVRWFSLRRTDVDAHLDHDAPDSRLVVRDPVSSGPLYIMMRAELPLLGAHNVMNALAAAQMAVDFGVAASVIRAALMDYRPLPHRLAPVATIDGVTWVDDSKATNPNAATAGLSAIEGSVVVLLGGSNKDTDFGPFAELVRARAKTAICFGATGPTISRALGPDFAHDLVPKMADAVVRAAAIARPGDTVLLSPACASFDEFKGYGHRGDVFAELVRALVPG